MKKTLAFILAILCVGAMVSGCGKKDENENTPSNSSIGTTSTESSESKKEDAVQSKAVDHKEFENLTLSEESYLIGSADEDESVRLRFPNNWFVSDLIDGMVAGEGTEDSVDKMSYAIFASVFGSGDPSKTTIDDRFSDIYYEFPSVFSQYNGGVYDEYTPNVVDKVTLTCGSEAVVFEGNQPATFDLGESGKKKAECYVRGYSFLLKDSGVIIGYVIFDNDTVDDAKEEELQYYINKMAQAVELAKT